MWLRNLNQPPLPAPQSSIRRAYFFLGARRGLKLPALVIAATMLGIGGLVREIGYPMLIGPLSTYLIWAGPAQVLLFGSIAAGAALPAVALAITLSGIRFLPMCVSMIPLLSSPKPKRWEFLLAMHLVSMSTWVEGLTRLPEIPEEGRLPYHCGFSLTVISAGAVAAGAGYYMAGALPTALGGGILFMTPLFFATSLAFAARSAPDWLALILGAGLAPFAAALAPAGFDIMTIGLFGGTAAYALDRIRRRRS